MSASASAATSAAVSLPRHGQLYVACIIAAGAAALGHASLTLLRTPAPTEWLLLAALTLLSGSFTIKVPSIPARLSVTETLVFTCVLLFGAAPATVTMALDGLIISLYRRYCFQRTLFNTAEAALSIWVASHIFFAIPGVELAQQPPVWRLILPMLVLTSIYFLLNSGLTTLAVAFETGRSAVQLWQKQFLWLSVNYLAGASVSLLLVGTVQHGSVRVVAVALPCLVISYLTFRASMGRVADADHHLAVLNRLYLSTIETLSVAIDAKDQVTHDHLRRVQSYAVHLARARGITDEETLKALEAAALLHDLGKLAVPEHILNKPGQLTPAEFEKVKLHVEVGADILATIQFPYPVVPIVRYHHESWDGSGYPHGLAGEAIPIGARILAVVDCFDALTSDRPYRPRLSDDAAFQVLRERAGTMYDPAIVETFVRMQAEMALEEPREMPHQRALAHISRASAIMPKLPDAGRAMRGVQATEEMLALCELARLASGQATSADAAFLISTHVKRVVPCALCAIYVLDPLADDLVARHVAGPGGAALTDLRIPRGHRLTGWVAANQQTLLNSDAVLDLGEFARNMDPPLRSCLSTPLLAGTRLVGVLTAYSAAPAVFTEDHSRVVQMVAPHIAQVLLRALELETRTLASPQNVGGSSADAQTRRSPSQWLH